MHVNFLLHTRHCSTLGRSIWARKRPALLIPMAYCLAQRDSVTNSTGLPSYSWCSCWVDHYFSSWPWAIGEHPYFPPPSIMLCTSDKRWKIARSVQTYKQTTTCKVVCKGDIKGGSDPQIILSADFTMLRNYLNWEFILGFCTGWFSVPTWQARVN